MKKILSLLFLAVLSSSLFAAFQYDIVTDPYVNAHYEGTDGNYFTVNITSGTGDLYIVDKINNKFSMSGNNEILSKVMSDYGYIDLQTGDYIQGTGETIITNEYQYNQWNDNIVQTAYKLGTFSEGDSIGVWIANKNGNLNTSVYTEFSHYGSYGLDGTDLFGTVLAEFDYQGSSPIFFGLYGEASTFSGQPLPGMLASFLLGGSVLGMAGLSKKKKERKTE
ncbi:MAG: hypothetical protein WCT05_04955 [Lentisphaeria bacterium]